MSRHTVKKYWHSFLSFCFTRQFIFLLAMHGCAQNLGLFQTTKNENAILWTVRGRTGTLRLSLHLPSQLISHGPSLLK